MSNFKKMLMAVGVLIAIISLSVFMFTASSTLFSILAGVGAVAVILLYDKCVTIFEKLDRMAKEDCIISKQSYRLFTMLKDDYKERHPEDKFFDP